MIGEDAGLTAEVREIVARLGGAVKAWRRPGTAAVLLALLLGGTLQAQTPAPERLYESGRCAPRRMGSPEESTTAPAVAAQWYNLGATYYRMGQKGEPRRRGSRLAGSLHANPPSGARSS